MRDDRLCHRRKGSAATLTVTASLELGTGPDPRCDTLAPDVDTVDVSDFRLDRLGHGWFTWPRGACRAIAAGCGAAPPERTYLDAVDDGGATFWMLRRSAQPRGGGGRPCEPVPRDSRARLSARARGAARGAAAGCAAGGPARRRAGPRSRGTRRGRARSRLRSRR